MRYFPFLPSSQWLKIFRVVVSLFLVAHGCIRIYAGTVGGFGEFLGSKGFPAGVVLAWGITVFEITGGLTLAAGYFVRWICAVFIVELLFGIWLVHAPNGWFVVGYTSGGMEYSVLLILSFLVVASTEKPEQDNILF